jgi:tRNA pseudouridine55 synthase
MLGCGAHLTELRRISCAGFDIKDSFTIENLSYKALAGDIKSSFVSLKDTIFDMPEIVADETLALKIKNGVKLTEHDISFEKFLEKNIKVLDKNNKLIAALNLNNNKYKYCCVFN